MTVELFKRFQATKPFQSFVIHLADGRAFPVNHPEAANLSPSGRTVLVFNRDSVLEVLDMLLVTSLRPVPEREQGLER